VSGKDILGFAKDDLENDIKTPIMGGRRYAMLTEVFHEVQS
jgi:hypothetical protein